MRKNTKTKYTHAANYHDTFINSSLRMKPRALAKYRQEKKRYIETYKYIHIYCKCIL